MFSAREVVELVLLLRKKDHPSDETSTKKCGEPVSVILDRFGMEAVLWSSSICVTTTVLVPDEEFFFTLPDTFLDYLSRKSVMKIKCKVKLPLELKITLYSF